MIHARGEVLALVCCSLWLLPTPARALGPNRVVNGSFEDSSATPDTPDLWSRQAFFPTSSLNWDFDVARDGLRSIRISSLSPNDAAWIQTVTLDPDRNYLLSGWIRTKNVAADPSGGGANLCLWGTWLHTAALTGSNDWTYVRLTFNSGPTGIVTLCARLGYWSALTEGVAWFDDLRVSEIVASDPHPRWKILVLIYAGTDFTYVDSDGSHRLVGTVGPAQLATAAANATRFVNTDIPALSSGNMVADLTVRYPGVLTRLSPIGSGWWPAPEDTARDRDPAFDSVIAIWQPTVTDQSTRQTLWIGTAAGLTPSMGTGQTYATLIIEAATQYGHLNVFKHEWGHSLLFYYEAAGISPSPTVTNHAVALQYVNCMGGPTYDWRDETDADPIPNSIYSNESGFTHDYYSGTAALATDPLRCLGVSAASWAAGGPVSQPGNLERPPSGVTIDRIRALLQQLAGQGFLHSTPVGPLLQRLDDAARALSGGDVSLTISMLASLRHELLVLQMDRRLLFSEGNLLIVFVDLFVEELGSSAGSQ